MRYEPAVTSWMKPPTTSEQAPRAEAKRALLTQGSKAQRAPPPFSPLNVVSVSPLFPAPALEHWSNDIRSSRRCVSCAGQTPVAPVLQAAQLPPCRFSSSSRHCASPAAPAAGVQAPHRSNSRRCVSATSPAAGLLQKAPAAVVSDRLEGARAPLDACQLRALSRGSSRRLVRSCLRAAPAAARA